MAEKMASLTVEETSGVDHPAHLDEGFIIVKQAEAVVPEMDEKDQMIAELQARVAELEEQLSMQASEEEPESVEDLVKEAPDPIAKAYAEMGDRLEKAEQQLAKAEDERATRKAEDYVAGLKSVTGVEVDLVKAISKTDIGGQVLDLLKSIDGQVDSAEMFKEIGSTGSTGDAGDRLEALAKAAVDADPSLTIQQARSRVALNNPDLYTEMKG